MGSEVGRWMELAQDRVQWRGVVLAIPGVWGLPVLVGLTLCEYRR
jgi:hypothetical protein